MKTCY